MSNQFRRTSIEINSGWVHYDESQESWMVTDLAAARKVLARHDLFGTEPYRLLQPDIADIKRFLTADKSKHRLLRRFMVKAFSHKRMPGVDTTILRPVAEKLSARLPETGIVDLQSEYVSPYTRAAMYGVIGLSDSAGDELVAAFRIANSFFTNERDVPRGSAAVALLREMAGNSCKNPDSYFGTASLLGLAREEGWTSQGLETADLVCFMMSLIEAAAMKDHRDVTATTLRWLATLPDSVQSKLSENSDSLASAAEEALRLQSNGGVLPRVALKNTSLFGHEVRAGERVLIMLSDVGLDAKGFVEPHSYSPERSDLDRAVTFGLGIHRCPGENIAKLICIRACQTLLQKYSISLANKSTQSLVSDIQYRVA